ncbi:hypothetical protein C8Q70DRAFT_1059293 [Cubamyces menziesii]|nr:hypothetical protein C8Q70DRAFT_1059293 [Cubamyces menziesii]
MSTPANSTLVSEAASSITLGYCSTSAAVLFVYYYLSTLDHEFKHYSERKITLATLLYIANRYVPLVYFIYNAPWIPFSSDHQPRTFPPFTDHVPFLARIPVIIADIIVVLITWKTQYSTHRLSKNLPNPKKLATIVLHNGTIYFVVLTALNILLLILEYLQIFTDSPVLENNSSDLSLLIEPLTAILVSEFLNDLHDAAGKTSGPETLSSVSALEFRIVGSIGASLPGPTDDETLDEAENTSHEDSEGSEREVSEEFEIDEQARGASEAEV